MERIKIIKNFLTKDECVYALDTKDYSFIYDKVKSYIDNFIQLKGYTFTKLLPFRLNTHIVGVNNPNWYVDEDAYISFLIQLNDAYKEGYFQFLVDEDENYFQLHHGYGHMIVYFSNLKNRTSPVEGGIKYTITSSISINKIDGFEKTII